MNDFEEGVLNKIFVEQSLKKLIDTVDDNYIILLLYMIMDGKDEKKIKKIMKLSDEEYYQLMDQIKEFFVS